MVERERQDFPEPECLGWYTPCLECDGDPDELTEPPCAARVGCRSLLVFIGGEELRDEATVEAVRKLWPAEKLARYVDDGAQMHPASVWEQRRAVSRTKSYRPREKKYEGALAVFDALVDRFVIDTGKTLVDESESYKRSGTAYVRWHANGDALLREVRKRIPERTIAKFTLHATSPTLNVLAYTDDFETAIGLDPPRGVQCRLWDEGGKARERLRTVLIGVTPSAARDAGTWLARLLNNGIIGTMKQREEAGEL